MNAFLEISRLTCRHDATIVFTDFSLSVEAGGHTALIGPSGCGKSTLLRIVAGLEAPECGTLSLDGRLATDGPRILIPAHRRGVAMVFQDLALWPNLTVLGNVELGLAAVPLSSAEKRSRAEDALALCRIAGLVAREPAQLSGGQQQRVALARALAVRPRLLLLDEPFSGLDQTLKSQLIDDMNALAAEQGITLLAATHDRSEAVALGCTIQGMV